MVLFEIPAVTSVNKFTDFTGEGNRNFTAPATTYNFHCAYKRNLTDKFRTSYGIDDDITAIIYLSPLEVKKFTGTKEFIASVKVNTQKVRITLFGVVYRIKRYIELEPMKVGTDMLSLAYEFRLITEP